MEVRESLRLEEIRAYRPGDRRNMPPSPARLHEVNSIEIMFAVVLAALLIALLAKRLDLPYPIALLVSGLALTASPVVPQIRLDPEIVFYVFLPPILFEAAYFTSWDDFCRWKRAILMLAFGLVTATSGFVALICHTLIPGMSWAAGFVLGAIISPPDAAAATSITRGLGLPRRVVQILEGESLVNDAAALTIYRFAIAAIVTGHFSWGETLLNFVWIAASGIAIGVVLGFGFVRLYPLLKDPEIEILSTFMLSFTSYLLAEAVHGSGVLAVVCAGLIVGHHSHRLFSATARIRGTAVWQTAIFLVNAVIFLLIGLQLPAVVRDLSGYPKHLLAGWSAAILGGVVLIRLLWVFPAAYLPRWMSARIREREPDPGLRPVLIVGWTGLRGVVSLAAALTLPMETGTGLPFPYRNLILLITFAVILGTLVLQGLSLRPLIRLLRIPRDHSGETEQLEARVFTTEQALARLAELEARGTIPEPVVERVRGYFQDKLADHRAQLEQETGSGLRERPELFKTIAEQRVWWELARAEREALLALRQQRRIGDEALRELQRDIDLLEARIVPRT